MRKTAGEGGCLSPWRDCNAVSQVVPRTDKKELFVLNMMFGADFFYTLASRETDTRKA
ncbi:MAG: hypothetical protein NC089_10010 [Bacteroides sp.]|nr:hypothetical protein [Bacteroides sp.]MCM1551039.1 hypothetical protein [Clostridium sp.]